MRKVPDGERSWIDFILEGPQAIGDFADNVEKYQAGWQLDPGETLAVLLEYVEAARRTDELIPTLDLDAAQPLPVAPWFEPGGRWSAPRRWAEPGRPSAPLAWTQQWSSQAGGTASVRACSGGVEPTAIW